MENKLNAILCLSKNMKVITSVLLPHFIEQHNKYYKICQHDHA